MLEALPLSRRGGLIAPLYGIDEDRPGQL